ARKANASASRKSADQPSSSAVTTGVDAASAIVARSGGLCDPPPAITIRPAPPARATPFAMLRAVKAVSVAAPLSVGSPATGAPAGARPPRRRRVVHRDAGRPPPARRNVGRAKVVHDRNAEPFRQRGRIADLNRQPALRRMENRLAVEPDQIDCRRAGPPLFLQELLDRLSMRVGDDPLGFGERARSRVAIRQPTRRGESAAEHIALAGI